jgi:Raf kinase inhibitor-like YbhB/YbcL family protein
LLLFSPFLLWGCQTLATKPVALSKLTPPATLTVTLPDIPANQPIPERFSNYGSNDIPTIQWSAPPAGTKSLVLLIEDPDAPGVTPYIHYLVFNIPPTATSLDKTLPDTARVGNNSNGEASYFGPRPPFGVHHYHFEVFALNMVLDADKGGSWETLQPKLMGQVLAGGEAVATYEKH